MNNNRKKLIAMLAAAVMICGQAGPAAPFVSVHAEETVSLTESLAVVIPENTYVTNGMFTITYDTDKLTLVSAEAGASFSGVLTAVNTRTPGTVTLGFVSAKPFNAGGNALELSFERKSGSESISDLCSLTVNEFVGEDGSGKETAVDSEKIKLEAAASEMTVSASEITSDGTDIIADISFSGNPGVTNGVITVKYDPSVIKFEEASAGQMLKNAVFEANGAQAGTVRIAFISSKAVTENGTAFSIKFSAVADGVSEVGLELNEFESSSVSGAVSRINASAVPGSVTVSSAKAELSVSASVSEDGKVSALVSIPEKTGVTNGVISVSYDPAVLKFESASACGVFEKAIAEANETVPGTVKIAFISSTGITAGGEAVKLEFSSSDSSDTEITVDTEEFSGISADGNVHRINTVPGSCTVKFGSEGSEPFDKYDINSDGRVTAIDILYFKRVIFEVEEDAQICRKADINGDGTVDVLDLMRLQRFIINS